MSQKDFSLQQTHLRSSKDCKSKKEPGKTKKGMAPNCHWRYHSIWIARQHMNSKKSLQGLKNRPPSTGMTTGTSNIKINKELVPGLEKWETVTYQVIISIYKYSENTRIQARATTEIYEQLLYFQ
ncbi:hypothetical protein BCV72DRAFT_325475, partial [Rhizopus microsporus var. microsporus]